MKVELVMLQEPILVSDDNGIKKGDWFLAKNNKCYKANHDVAIFGTGCVKVMAGIEDLPLINFSALSEEDQKKIGWVDVEKLIKKVMGLPNYLPLKSMAPSMLGSYEFGIECFNLSKSINEKQFTLEDMIKAAKYGYEFRNTTSFPNDNFEDSCVNNFKQALSSIIQPKMFDVKIDMEILSQPYGHGYFSQPKIINNSIKILEINEIQINK